MPSRSRSERAAFLARLRAGGPSYELLELLHAHRVLATGQAAQATGAPERTTRYRLGRLQRHGLVAARRPGREAGSAPRQWWLTVAGARLVTGATAVKAPSATFADHSTAIAAVWLAVRDHGPDAGVQLRRWLPDRAGWQQTPADAAAVGEGVLVTPDAVAHVDVGGAPATVMVEVDLATMTTGKLAAKLTRYAAYAAGGGWREVTDHCPPLLVLTTTTARAASFATAAARVLRRTTTIDPAGELRVYACGLVYNPRAAVAGAVWREYRDDTPVTLADILREAAGRAGSAAPVGDSCSHAA